MTQIEMYDMIQKDIRKMSRLKTKINKWARYSREYTDRGYDKIENVYTKETPAENELMGLIIDNDVRIPFNKLVAKIEADLDTYKQQYT